MRLNVRNYVHNLTVPANNSSAVYLWIRDDYEIYRNLTESMAALYSEKILNTTDIFNYRDFRTRTLTVLGVFFFINIRVTNNTETQCLIKRSKKVRRTVGFLMNCF